MASHPFDVNITLLQQLGVPSTKFVNLTETTAANFVFVTGVSDNHFMESQDMIGGIQKYYPEMEIIYYDLGLSKSNKEMVRTTTGNSHKSKQLHV